jgi:DNA-binding cell septation regulator SpoVG
MRIEITRMFLTKKPDSKCLAFFSWGIWLKDNSREKPEIEINDCMVLKSNNEGEPPWCVQPSKKNESNGKFSSIVWLDDQDLRNKITKLALDRYEVEFKKSGMVAKQIAAAFDSDDDIPF